MHNQPLLRNWNEKMSSSIVAGSFLCPSGLLGKCIAWIMDSRSVVKNSEASSCLPTPNTREIS